MKPFNIGIPCGYRVGSGPECGKPSTGFGLCDEHRHEINETLEKNAKEFAETCRTIAHAQNQRRN
jgi:hypothetical protein